MRWMTCAVLLTSVLLLEEKTRSSQDTSATLRGLLRRILDSVDNLTGGGTASAIASAMAALVGMIARLSMGKEIILQL